MRSAGFKQHGVSLITKRAKEFDASGLSERFAAGNFDAIDAEGADLIEDFGHWNPGALGECVGGIAPYATKRATGQADEDAWQTRVAGFALKRGVNLIDEQGGFGRGEGRGHWDQLGGGMESRSMEGSAGATGLSWFWMLEGVEEGGGGARRDAAREVDLGPLSPGRASLHLLRPPEFI